MEKQQEKMKTRQEKLCLNCGICSESDIPASAWEGLPQDCMLEGLFFQEREKIKHIIRKQKEELLILEIELKEKSKKNSKHIKKEIDKIIKEIKKYSKYGSEDW